MKGKEKVVAGSVKTKVQGLVSKVMPDGAKAEMHRKTAEPGPPSSAPQSNRGRHLRVLLWTSRSAEG